MTPGDRTSTLDCSTLVGMSLTAICVAVSITSKVSASYLLYVRSNGANSVAALPGSIVPVDLNLVATGTESCTAIITRLETETPGLTIVGYDWTYPFANGDDGSMFDLSTPAWDNLPSDWSATALQGVGYPANSIDLELANYTLGSGSPPLAFGSGTVVRILIELPPSCIGGEVFTIEPVPDLIVNGFTAIPSFAAGSLTIEVLPPAPGADLDGDGTIGAADLAILLGQFGGPCPEYSEDLNDDGVVNASDLAVLVGLFGSSGPEGDFNGDGSVGQSDIAIFLGKWDAVEPVCADLTGDGIVGPPDLAVLLGAWCWRL